VNEYETNCSFFTVFFGPGCLRPGRTGRNTYPNRLTTVVNPLTGGNRNGRSNGHYRSNGHVTGRYAFTHA
jgi:hypothetical protein